MRVHFAHHTLTPVKQWKLKKATIIFIKNTNLLFFSSLGNAIINITINLLLNNIKQMIKRLTDLKSLNHHITLKVQSCKSYDNKYMIASTQITNTEIFAYKAVLLF